MGGQSPIILMPRTSQQTQASNRSRLLEAAAAAFAREGLDAANINDISLGAGLAKGTVYNYFASKEALFAAVVEEACRRVSADAAVPGPEIPTGERLRRLLAADIDWAQRNEAFARVLVGEVFSGKPELYGRVVEAATPYIGGVAEILDDGVARGEVRTDTAVAQLALIFTGLGLMALAQHWGSGGAWPPLETIPDLVTGLFLEGARPRPAPPIQRAERSRRGGKRAGPRGNHER